MMGRLILGTGIVGISAITLIDYRLANARIADCVFVDADCIARATAQRDAVLIHGLSALLAFALLALIVVAILRARQFQQGKGGFSFRPAKPERRPLPRP